MELKCDVVLITGGTSGIGLELAQQLLAMGNTVIVTGRNTEKLAAVRASLPGVHAFSCDVTDQSAVSRLYSEVTAEFPNLNILINNAGLMRTLDLTDVANDAITSEIDTNLKAPIEMVQKFLPHLLVQPAAAIMNITSGLAFVEFEQTPIYCASKIGLHMYTRILRKQLKGTSVKVFDLAPPKTTSAMIDRATSPHGSSNRMPTIEVSKVVSDAIRGMQQNKYEILPGMSKALKLAGKVTL